MADDKKKRRTKRKAAGARRKFSTASQARAQLEGITLAQERYRRARRQNASSENEATDAEAEGIIVESLGKSEQAWKNALRAVRGPEDLNGFD